MAKDNDNKLTRHKSGETIVTAEVMNKLYGGEFGFNETADEFDPLVAGHVHDGIHADGHSSKVLLTDGSHVRGYLYTANLGGTDGTPPAVGYHNVKSYSDLIYGSPSQRREAAGGSEPEYLAIPEYREDPDTGERFYYLDLSKSAGGAEGSIQFNKGGSFFGNEDLFYDYNNSRVGLGTNTPEAKLHIFADSGSAIKIEGLGNGTGTALALDSSGYVVLDTTINGGDITGPDPSTQWAIAQFADTTGDLLTETPLGSDGEFLVVDSGAPAGLSWAVPSLDDLADVNAPSPSGGQVLTWNSGVSEWQPQTPATWVDGPGSSTQWAIAQFADTTGGLLTETPLGSDGELLVVDSGAAAGLSWTTLGLQDLDDVESPLAPAGGDLLIYNSGTSEWEAGGLDLNDLGDVLAAPSDGFVLTYNSGTNTWTSRSISHFYSQWVPDIQWIAEVGFTGGALTNYKFPIPLQYAGANRTIHTRALFDNNGVFYANIPLPLNGRLSEGDVNRSVTGSHQGTFSTSPDHYIDDVSGIPADAPSSCRLTLYFILNGGTSAGAISNLKVKIYYGSSTDPSTPAGGKIFEFEDGQYIQDEYWNDLNESGGILLEGTHSYTGPHNDGKLVISDFSPLKLNPAQVASGICTFKVEVIPDPTDSYFGSGETFSPKYMGLMGVRFLWIWD